ncbi:MAG: hypothetical protein KF802_01950 [Bdellovibrionaceae bacterium]|nr:hypothetical protein [Pseudobdellovibrionaceae bacterium]MBX3033920.1 hypothetical protein [Pseudobdellovibrionaceae bacterium]
MKNFVLIAALLGPGVAAAALPWISSAPTASLKSEAVSSQWNWQPSGYESTPISAECHWTRMEKVLWAGGSEDALAGRLEKWFSRCGPELSKDRRPSPLNLLQFINVNHSLKQAPYLQRVTFGLSDGRILRGLAAFKPGNRPRPLVIAMCGVFCRIENGPSLRAFYMQLFEESPFHLIMLGNPTGADFSIDNGSVAMGGFDGGAMILDVVKKVRASSLNQKITSIHVTGVSLGSHSVLYASLYDSFAANGFPTVSSFTAVCPVVDLQASVERGMTGALRGSYYRSQTRVFLEQVTRHIPILSALAPSLQASGNNPLRILFNEGVVSYYNGFNGRAPWDLQPLQGRRINSSQDLKEINRFQNWARFVRRPTLALYTHDDEFVVPTVNSTRLVRSLGAVPNRQLGVTGVAHGNHCAMAASYGWRNYTALLRGHILAHTAERASYLRLSATIPFVARPGDFPLGSQGRVVAYGWELQAGSAQVRLRLRAFQPIARECQRRENDLNLTPPDCSPEFSASYPVSMFSAAGLRVPNSSFEANTMSRWLNANSWILGPNGEEITGQIETLPAAVRVRGAYEL